MTAIPIAAIAIAGEEIAKVPYSAAVTLVAKPSSGRLDRLKRFLHFTGLGLLPCVASISRLRRWRRLGVGSMDSHY